MENVTLSCAQEFDLVQEEKEPDNGFNGGRMALNAHNAHIQG